MSPAVTAFACAVLGIVWGVVTATARRDLVLVTVGLALLAPASVPLWVGGSKVAVAAAELAFLPALIVLGLRHSRPRAIGEALKRNLLTPFAVLYLEAGLYGFFWGVLRGNSLVLAAGQTATAIVFVIGFSVAGPLVAERLSARALLLFSAAVAAVMLPGVVPFVGWLIHSRHATFMRYLGAPAVFAPLLTVLVLAKGWRLSPRIAIFGAAFFSGVTLITFTRSYWLGLIAGLAVLALASVLRWLQWPLRRWSVKPSDVLILAAAVSAVALGVVLTPVGHFVVTRVAETRSTTLDLSVIVRRNELDAAWASVQAHPFSGIGAGGRFLSLYQVGANDAFFGPTNFIHNAYLYLPLKFGFLGAAAFAAFVLGLTATCAMAFSEARSVGMEAVAFPAAFVCLAVLSITAPNLVDPRYSVLAGLLAYLAGSRSKRTRWGFLGSGVPAVQKARIKLFGGARPDSESSSPHKRQESARSPALTPSVRLAVVCVAAILLGLAIALIVDFTGESSSARTRTATGSVAGTRSEQLTAITAGSPSNLIDGTEISAAGGGPASTVLRWWQAIQFYALPTQLVPYYAPSAHVASTALARQVPPIRYYFIANRPVIVDQSLIGHGAQVFALLSHGRMSSTNPSVAETPVIFDLVRVSGQWLLADNAFVTKRSAAEAAYRRR